MRITLLIFPLLFLLGCSNKVTIDYENYQKHGNRYVENLSDSQSGNFDSLIIKYSKKYDVDKKLVKAIIKKESNFNPKALNPKSGATGLMQIKPETAGADVYQKIFKKSGRPSRSELKNAEHNIEIGTAYLTVLAGYLGNIKDRVALEYCIISAFNSGAGAVLEVFNSNRKKAVDVINSLSANEVYDILTTKHPRGESREYLKKVLAYKNIMKI
jgi:membrane-bound lytic murein transglycosylase C